MSGLTIERNFRSQRIAVLLGGPSGEREVSLRSGAAVLKALKERDYLAVSIDAGRDLLTRLEREKIEVVYNALHGTWGEDGLVQGLLETARIPYTGSGVTSSVLTMNKVLTKRLWMDENLATPEQVLVTAQQKLRPVDLPFGFPAVVKPASEGSSLGITICKKPSELQGAIDLALKRDRQALIERFIPGRELTVGVINGVALPVVEIVPKAEFYDYQSKYTPGASAYFCPADIDPAVADQMKQMAAKSYEIFSCRGGVRVDFRLDPQNSPYLIEINSSPGMTELSLLPMAAKAQGLAFADLVELILDSAALEARINW